MIKNVFLGGLLFFVCWNLFFLIGRVFVEFSPTLGLFLWFLLALALTLLAEKLFIHRPRNTTSPNSQTTESK
jgi:hypothetical protein